MSTIGKLKIGTEVIVFTSDIPNVKGKVKFIGKIDGKDDEFIGVEIDEPIGKNSGDYNGKSYFKVENINPGNYGVFVKPKSLKYLNGSPVEQSKEGKQVKEVKEGKQVKEVKEVKETKPPVANKKPVGTAPTTVTKNPVKTTVTSNPANKNKLSNEIAETQNNELGLLKEELENTYERIKQLESLDSNKEIQSLKVKLKQYEEINRSLKIESEKVKYSVGVDQDQKLKELNEKLNFFQSQKEFGEKEKADLKKKIGRLEAELEEQEEKDDMIDKLTVKVENLEAKNEKIKQELEAAKTDLMNNKVLGGSEGNSANEEELTETIRTLNEMIALLESDLNEEKDKNTQLTQTLELNSGKISELAKIQRKLKSKEEEIEILKAEVQNYSDAANFVEKLTLNLISKEEALKEKTVKLSQFVLQVERLEIDNAQSKEMIDLQALELESQEEEIQKMMNEKGQQQNNVIQLNNQIAKYKQKIRQLSDNNSTLLNSMSEQREDESVIKNYFNTDIYQHKYYELQKIHQQVNQRFINYQLQFSAIRNQVGVFMLNLVDTLPESYTAKLYPEITHMIVRIKTTNDKLYLLFDAICNQLKEKSDVFSKENSDLAQWMIMLLDQIPVLYGLLYKIELAFTASQTQDEVSEIFSHHVLKDEVNRIDLFASELLQRIATENIDIEINIDPFIEPTENLDKICLEIKRLPAQFATKLDLCSETMRAVHKIFQTIHIYKSTSEANQTAQVDTMIENFLKILMTYLRECCTNPHIRLKGDMKNYLNGLDLVIKIFKEIQINQTVQELNSLYSETEDIKMLKETILTTQFHAKQLLADLDQISYSNVMSKIQVKLPGKIWQDKFKMIKGELNKFQETLIEKEELQRSLIESKKKMLTLEKEIKDRQTTKEVHEKRIGELQLKVEQFSFLENEFKRQTQKIKSIQDTNKLIEDQLNSQIRKKKEVEEELKKSKEKYDILQTDAMLKFKKQKKDQTLSSEDVANLTIFKSVLTDCNTLRNIDLKKKITHLKLSPIINLQHPKMEHQIPAGVLRRKFMNSITDLQVNAFDGKTPKNNMNNLFAQLNKFVFEQKQPLKERRDYQVGEVRIMDFGQLRVNIDESKISIVSF